MKHALEALFAFFGLLVAGSRGQDNDDLPSVVDDRFTLSQVYSHMHVSGGPTQTILSPCSDHVLVFGKAGHVKIYPAPESAHTHGSWEILVDIKDDVNAWGDHGLLSSQLHPDFPAEPYLFLFYSVAPEGWAGECERIVKGLPFCEQNAVLERLKIDVTVDDDGMCSDWSFSDSENNRVRLMEDWCSSAGAHHNAAMEFYTDGSLLVANGDSSQAPFDRGYPAEDGTPVDLCYLDDEKQPQGYFKAQNEAFLQGHLIRIHAKATMYDSEDLPLTEFDYDVWAKGLRNPFRLDIDRQTGDIYLGDVGDSTAEEINILRNPLDAAASSLPANLGWPCVEGGGIPLPTYNWISQSCDVNDDNNNCDICKAIFACTTKPLGTVDLCDPAYVPPSFQYDHAGSLTTYDGQEDRCDVVGSSISAIAFFEGRLYAADYTRKCLWFFDADSDGSPDLAKPHIIAEGFGAEFADLVDGGDGYLYGTNFALSKLVRIEPVNLDALETSFSSFSPAPTASTAESDDGNETDGTETDQPFLDDSTDADAQGTASPVEDEPTPSPVGETVSPTSEVLKAPIARLRGKVKGYCFSPCEIEVGTEIRFTALLSGAYGDDNNITEYSISYGDGSEGYTGSSSGPHPHVYNDDGVFIASATVTDSEGLTGTESMTVVVGEPFSLEMTPESGEWVVGDTIQLPFAWFRVVLSHAYTAEQFNLTRAKASTVPDTITWDSKIEHCTTNRCTGETGCHIHSLQGVDTADDGMSGSVVSVAHPLPSQVIISAQMIFGTTVIDYDWPTAALKRTVTTSSVPPGLALYYGDEICEFTPCTADFMSGYAASFAASSIQSTDLKVYEFVRWVVTYPDNSTDIVKVPALNNLRVDVDGLTIAAEYQVLAPVFVGDMPPPVITAIGGFYTKIAVEWASVLEEGIDTVIAYVKTPDHDSSTYQSSKAALSDLSSSTELLVPVGRSNYTVYLRAYNSVNNTVSAKSTDYVVESADSLDPSENLCPEDVPLVGVEVQFHANASVVPGIIQAEDFDDGGEGVAYHDTNATNEGTSMLREGEGVDLERIGDTVVNVAWTAPGEWISYTVQHPGSETVVQDVSVRYAVLGHWNGIALCLDLEDPSECPKLGEGDEQVIMLNSNLPETGSYSDWNWTKNASVALTPGPHVVTLCFIGNAVVNVDLLRFRESDCSNGVCQWVDGEETCITCPQDCGECPAAYVPLRVPGDVEAEDFDIGGEGVGFHENECVSSETKNCTEVQGMLSEYRNESSKEGLVELRDADGTVSWGWTGIGEWLTYTVMVSVTSDYNVTLRYASASTGQAVIFLDTYTCDVKEGKGAFLGSFLMPDSGGEAGPFSRTAPFTTRLQAGQHSIRVCVATGGFTLDKISFDLQTSGVCNDDGKCDVGDDEGCMSCEDDCVCSEGQWYGLVKTPIPGFVEAYKFDEGGNGVAYYDDTKGNLGLVGLRTDESVDIEAGWDGSLHVAYGTPGEWLKYTVYASDSGLFNVAAKYSTLGNSTALSITLDDGTDDACDDNLKDSLVFYGTNLPSSGGWDVWTETIPVEVALPAGSHVFKLCIINTTGASDTNLKGLNIQTA